MLTLTPLDLAVAFLAGLVLGLLVARAFPLPASKEVDP